MNITTLTWMTSSALACIAGCMTETEGPDEAELAQAMESGSTLAFDWQWRSGALLTIDGTRGTRYCTGTLIGTRRVLTAASCDPRVGDRVLFYTTSSSVNEASDRTIDAIVAPGGVDPRTGDLTESAGEFADMAIVRLTLDAPAGTQVATVAWSYPAGGDDAGFKVGAGEHDGNPTSATLLTRSDWTYSDHDNDGHFLTENQQTDDEDTGGPFYFNRRVLGVLHGSAWEWANRDKYASTAERISSFIVPNSGFVWPGGPNLSNTSLQGTVSEMFPTSSWNVCRYACARTTGCVAVSLASDQATCRLFSSVTGTITGFFGRTSAFR